jgi:GR25 family glycosyltransferase involved in LPS biosynthesis
MESQTFVEYEIVDTIMDKSYITDSFAEAEYAFEKGMMVYEHHITICDQTTHAKNINRCTTLWEYVQKEEKLP